MRIVTINTGKGDGAYAHRLNWLCDELARLDADVILLQEALAEVDGDLSTAGFLATTLHRHAYWSPARRKRRLVEGAWRDTWSGLVVLSRWESLDSATLELPSHPDDGQRVAQLVRLPAATAPLIIANLHLSHLPGQDTLRHRQLETVLDHPWLTGTGAMGLVGGDFNTPLSRLDALLAGQPQHLIDPFGSATPEAERATIPVAPSASPRRCIDYLLLTNHPSAPPLRVATTRVVLNRPSSDGAYPSDHCGVLLDVVAEDIRRTDSGNVMPAQERS